MKPFSAVAAVVFALLALLQLLRFALGWDIVVNGFRIPLWPSAVAFVFAAGLATMLWREARR